MKYLTKTITLPNGKRKYVRGKTKKELEEKLAALKKELELGLDVCSNPTFKSYTDSWYKTTREPYVTRNTADQMKGVLKNHIYPYIGTLKIKDIRGPHIREVLYKCSNLSRKMQSTVLGLMRGAFNSAVDDGLLLRSPVPLTIRLSGNQTAEAEYLSPEQEQQLLDAAKGTAIYPFVYTILRTGLRRGEITGLMWRDLDYEKKVLYVRRHVICDQKGKPEIVDGAKTAAGVRVVPMPPDLVDYLRERQKTANSVYVFPNSKGGVVSYALLSKMWLELDNRVGFHTHPHMLRHTYATKLFEAGTLDIRQIQVVMGHSDPSITLRVYTHYRAEMRNEETLQRVLAALADTEGTADKADNVAQPVAQ